MPYKFTLKLSYNLESDNEQDAIYELVDLIKRDWQYYADEGNLVEVKGKRSKTVTKPRSRTRDKRRAPTTLKGTTGRCKLPNTFP